MNDTKRHIIILYNKLLSNCTLYWYNNNHYCIESNTNDSTTIFLESYIVYRLKLAAECFFFFRIQMFLQ